MVFLDEVIVPYEGGLGVKGLITAAARMFAVK
jgi:hypothetical protein